VSGVLPVDLDDELAPMPEFVEDQTDRVLANMERMLATQGLARKASR
jgi:enamine deaminase RidA (YjgF/YER057c/UK114 family)